MEDFEETTQEERDYTVSVTLRIKFVNKEFNCLLRPELKNSIIKCFREINHGYMNEGSETVQFLGDDEATLEYDFSCNDTSEAEAESFARYNNHEALEVLKHYGFTLKSEQYDAEEADMSWLDELEDNIFR